MHKSTKIILTLIVLSAFAFASVSVPLASETHQTQCPIRGGAINKNVYTDYQGKRIYFCCPPCVSDFKKDPEKYMKKFEEEGVALENAPGAKKK
jgi:YHS domain-containing protein